MGEPGGAVVSVLIPAYNGERFLAEALRSVTGQTHGDLEVVVCDDGSTDATEEIARAVAAEDSRVRVERNPEHLGPVGNFERCLARASAPYVKYLMQDDVLEPTAIERLLGALLEADDVVLATSRRTLVDERGRPLPDRPEVRPPFSRDTVVDGHALGDLVLEENLNVIGEPSTVLFRRAALGEARPFRLGGDRYRYLADVALWLQLLSRGSAAYLTSPLSRSRQHRDQDSRVRSNMVVSVLEWRRLHQEAPTLGFLATEALRDRARRRWLENAPFFFRFCSGVPEAIRLFRGIAGANVELLGLARATGRRAAMRTGLRSMASVLGAAVLVPVAGLGAGPAHRMRSALRRRRRGGLAEAGAEVGDPLGPRGVGDEEGHASRGDGDGASSVTGGQ